MAAQRKRRKVTWPKMNKDDIPLRNVIGEYLQYHDGLNHSPKTVRWHSDILFALNGFLGAEAQLADLTVSRRRAEEALRETQARLQTVVTGAPIVLFALDRDGVFTISEGKSLDALGLKPGEVVGQCLFELYADVPQIVEDSRRALKGEEFTSIVDIGGLTFEARYSPIRDESGL